jgi:beta-1,4-mannosyl-glycoprotein beta-1,4-N-acetylglucosaminyltransferase
MKIYDCITYFDEKILFEIRLNCLDKYVDKFIVVESAYAHSGKKKKINFNINDYPLFKKKIHYIVIKDKPKTIKIPENKFKRLNSIARIDFQRQAIKKYLDEINSHSDDVVIYSDSDEIPNLRNIDLRNFKEKIIIFKQNLYYYKFNLELKTVSWFGSRACKFKNLKNISWLRNIKPKKYSWYRFDTLFKKNKEINIKIIKNGGWHFSQLMNPKQIQYKFLNDEHHDEYELNKVKYKKIEDMVKKKYIIYNHHVDKKEPKKKWNNKIFLTQVGINKLPYYIKKNKRKYNNWISK